jgi:hypothetical protein
MVLEARFVYHVISHNLGSYLFMLEERVNLIETQLNECNLLDSIVQTKLAEIRHHVELYKPIYTNALALKSSLFANPLPPLIQAAKDWLDHAQHELPSSVESLIQHLEQPAFASVQKYRFSVELAPFKTSDTWAKYLRQLTDSPK